MVFPRSCNIVDGIFSKYNKNDVWKEINEIHKLNATFLPSKSEELLAAIVSGDVITSAGPIKVEIVIPKDYLLDPDGTVVYPIIKIKTLPEGFSLSKTCDMVSTDEQTLNIDKIMPEFEDDPSITGVLDIFQKEVIKNGNPIFVKEHNAADVLEAVKPLFDELNNIFNEANTIKEISTMENSFSKTLDDFSDLLTDYRTNLNFSYNNYQETVNAQKLIITPQFDESLEEYSRLAKYQSTKDFLEKMMNDNIISPKEFINGVKDVAAMDFEERILPTLF